MDKNPVSCLKSKHPVASVPRSHLMCPLEPRSKGFVRLALSFDLNSSLGSPRALDIPTGKTAPESLADSTCKNFTNHPSDPFHCSALATHRYSPPVAFPYIP